MNKIFSILFTFIIIAAMKGNGQDRQELKYQFLNSVGILGALAGTGITVNAILLCETKPEVKSITTTFINNQVTSIDTAYDKHKNIQGRNLLFLGIPVMLGGLYLSVKSIIKLKYLNNLRMNFKYNKIEFEYNY